MRILHFIAAPLLALVLAPYLSAQRPLLPDHFGSMRMGTCAVKPVHPALSPEAGELNFLSCEFSSKSEIVSIWAGRFRDPSSGYEVYSSLINPSMRPSLIGKNSAVDGERLVALVGNIVFEVRPPQAISTKDLQDLVSVLRAGADQTPLPPLRTYLPDRNLVDGTQRYALGPAAFRAAAAELNRGAFTALTEAVGFSDGAEAMLAQYRSGKGEAVLLLLDYPTPQLAVYHQKHLELGLSEIAGLSQTPIEQKGSLLVIVLAPSSAAYAASLRRAVNYETQVTWNEPIHTLTDPPWTSVIAKIIIGTGVFMVAAVVLGIAFGGVRVVTKRLFPGKVFDRPDRMEILQLGLSGKRIDPSDFY
ncbi:MAG: DUF6599 family protein [Candidatus Acidiferrales bacterium]